MQVTKKPVSIGQWFSKGWDIISQDLGMFLLISFFYLVIIGVASSTVVGEFLVIGPLSVGVYYIVFEKMRGKPINVGDLSQGFNIFAAAILSNILATVFISFGILFCIIPGLIIAALYIFVPAILAENKELDFWSAMEASRKIAQPYVFELSIFLIVIGIVNIAGVLFCGIGIFLTTPLTMAATAVAYDEIVGIKKQNEQ